jgi:hypothetical protein
MHAELSDPRLESRPEFSEHRLELLLSWELSDTLLDETDARGDGLTALWGPLPPVRSVPARLHVVNTKDNASHQTRVKATSTEVVCRAACAPKDQ